MVYVERAVIAGVLLLIAEAIMSMLEPEFQIVGIVSDARGLLDCLAELQPNVVVLEISTPHLQGLDIGGQIKTMPRGTMLIYLTDCSSTEIAAEAFRRGASGYVLKQGAFDELRIAIRKAMHGETYVSSMLNREEVALRRCLKSKRRGASQITERHRQILKLFANPDFSRPVGKQ